MQHGQPRHIEEMMAVAIESYELQFFQAGAFFSQPLPEISAQRVVPARDVRSQRIEQSNIIKIFSVAAVIFLPPTLIASVYGMNFPIPELTWRYGYYIALGLMMFAAWLPYKYFKYRKWL